MKKKARPVLRPFTQDQAQPEPVIAVIRGAKDTHFHPEFQPLDDKGERECNYRNCTFRFKPKKPWKGFCCTSHRLMELARKKKDAERSIKLISHSQ